MVHKKIKWVISLVSILIIGLSSATVFALPAAAAASSSHVNSASTSSGQPTSQVHGSSSAGGANSHASVGQANGQTNSSKGKAIACQNRQNAVKTIISRLDTRISNQLSLFTAIAGRVESFYSKSGNKVTNYNQLLANLSTTSGALRTEYTTLKTNSTFSCSFSHPKAVVNSFLGDLHVVISDLQAYKTSVKNLIVAVAKANNVSLTANTKTKS